MIKMKRITKMEIADDPRMMLPMANLIRDLCEQMGMVEVIRHNFYKALRDILLSRQRNAYTKSGGLFRIDIATLGKRVRVSISDKGLPYHFSQLGILSDEDNPDIDLRDLANYGIHYGIKTLGKNGQMIYLDFKVPRQLIIRKKRQREPLPLDTDFSLRELRPVKEDIMQAIHVLYDEYGFTYGNDSLYDVDYFLKALNERSFASFLIENQHNEAAGYQALLYLPDLPGMLELATLVIKRRFRKYGLASMGFDDGLARAAEADAQALLVMPVAHHPYTQRICLSRHIRPTGFLLNYLQSELQCDLFTKGVRLPIGVASIMLRETESVSLHPPQAHREFIEQRATAIGMKADMGGNSTPFQAATAFKLAPVERLKISSMFAQRIGNDFDFIVRAFVKEGMLKRLEMLNLYINLREPACAYAYEAAKEYGFHFMGAILGARGVDYLMMQNFMGTAIYLDVIKPYGEFAQVLDYVLQDLPKEMVISNKYDGEQIANTP